MGAEKWEPGQPREIPVGTPRLDFDSIRRTNSWFVGKPEVNNPSQLVKNRDYTHPPGPGFSPQVGRSRALSTLDEGNGLLLAHRATDSATVAPALIDYSFLIGGAPG